MVLNREIIFSLMAKHGLSGADLAARVGVTRQMVSSWLSGRRNRVRPATAGKLAAALGVDVMELGGFNDNGK